MAEQDEIRARRRALEDAYGALYEKVSRILFRHDPIGINVETNTDEYEPAVGTILLRLVAARSLADVRRIVHEEFVRWFSPDDAGDEKRYAPIANEVWQAYQRFAASEPVALAKVAWAVGKDLDAGRLLYESLSNEQRPAWAANILRAVVARVDAPASVAQILDVAEDSRRWSEGHDVFGAVRVLTLQQERAGRPDERLAALLDLAEKAAKVVYNASGRPAPFDHNAGWRVAPSLRAAIRAVGDEELTTAAETALFARTKAVADPI